MAKRASQGGASRDKVRRKAAGKTQAGKNGAADAGTAGGESAVGETAEGETVDGESVDVQASAARLRGNEAEFKKLMAELRPEYRLQQEMVRARMRRNWTQKDLAARMGTTQSAVARLESGASSPSIKTLRKLAQVTGSELVVELR